MSVAGTFVDDDDGVEDVVKLIAVDLPHPASMAFGLEAQFPLLAAVMICETRTDRGFKVLVRDPYDERLAQLRRLGMLPVLGTQPNRDDLEGGFYLGGYARLVRRELILLRRSRL